MLLNNTSREQWEHCPTPSFSNIPPMEMTLSHCPILEVKNSTKLSSVLSMITFILLSLHHRNNEGIWKMRSWMEFITSSQNMWMIMRTPSCEWSSKTGGVMELGKGDVGFSIWWHQKENLVGSQETWHPIAHTIKVDPMCIQGTTTRWHWRHRFQRIPVSHFKTLPCVHLHPTGKWTV